MIIIRRAPRRLARAGKPAAGWTTKTADPRATLRRGTPSGRGEESRVARRDPSDRSEVLLHLVNQTPDLSGKTYDRVGVVWRRRGLQPDLRQIDVRTGSLSGDPIGTSPETWSRRGC